MSLEFFKVVKEKFQLALLQELKRDNGIEVANFEGISKVCSTSYGKLYFQPRAFHKKKCRVYI